MQLNLKPTHKPVQDYYAALQQLGQLHFDSESQVRGAFEGLLRHCGRQLKWSLIPEYPIKRRNQPSLFVDGALIDDSRLVRGMWEAKDIHDNLEREVRHKLALGYPDKNIIFQAPTQAILVQSGAVVEKDDISEPEVLVRMVRHFFEYRTPEIQKWEDAVARFREEVPEQARALKELIDREYQKNASYRAAFRTFVDTCRAALNPQLSEEAVERMLIQHILTERIFTKLFDNDEFRTRNVVSAEIEKVVTALIKGAFNRTEFLRKLDPFYKAIELSAKTTDSYEEKQGFLNTVYERFFQGYSPKEADTHGIVYTPQSIVKFMVRSVEDILQKEFGRSLADKDVHIIDPFVGTGNFIICVMREIAEKRKSALQYKYANELHCNEVMLLPYYIASMNIEHEFLDQTGKYEPFPGICLVDTFELSEASQTKLGFMNEENTARVRHQKQSPIFVILGNPPYNMGQVDENDNNKNRQYKSLDKEITETYARDSEATLLTKLRDPYVKAIRWATDRLQAEGGVIAFITNTSFVEGRAFDGMRQHLANEFDAIYILDLGGDVRKNPKLSGTTHNVFGIQVGVSINLFIRRTGKHVEGRRAEIRYARLDEYLRKEQKYAYLEERERASRVEWETVARNVPRVWIDQNCASDFSKLLPVADRRGGRRYFVCLVQV